MPISRTDTPRPWRIHFANILTMLRALFTPVLMSLIILGWPDNKVALFCCALLIIAALSDLFEDLVCGYQIPLQRKFGWYDTIADNVLNAGLLIALFYVIERAGLMTYLFAIPACTLLLCDGITGLAFGYELSLRPHRRRSLDSFKTTLTLMALCILIASPWLTVIQDRLNTDEKKIFTIYNQPAIDIWRIGHTMLWISALLSLLSTYRLFTKPESRS